MFHPSAPGKAESTGRAVFGFLNLFFSFSKEFLKIFYDLF